MEVVKRRRNNSEKYPRIGNQFFQRESLTTSVIQLVFQYYIRRFIQTSLLSRQSFVYFYFPSNTMLLSREIGLFQASITQNLLTFVQKNFMQLQIDVKNYPLCKDNITIISKPILQCVKISTKKQLTPIVLIIYQKD